ncbi:Molybdenum cofactor biosynthesis protein B [Corynebacterium occultum]|uniref:Molybdenum cofactor biosynthesis protein B n=1 Tax=Corynebacterium occultum TaxID=2675219 RepID=A0A6B8VXZ3_9CORY|nr:MogA/MoaB family molybdenum cofactor biosynthesis protein [Corynebacterium occultum]QGU06214.1 Molybdenum cofactor biosynthesis protein B [Corynebacterium occultum]
MPKTGLVIVSSTRAAAGEYEDRSGPILVNFLREQGFETPDALVVKDADMPASMAKLLSSPEKLPAVLLTSGGTGLSPDDRTVEAVSPHLDRELPGIVHAFWDLGQEKIATAVLSRAVAGTIGRTFVMTLPGSTGGVRDGVAILAPILGHITEQLEGNHEH